VTVSLESGEVTVLSLESGVVTVVVELASVLSADEAESASAGARGVTINKKANNRAVSFFKGSKLKFATSKTGGSPLAENNLRFKYFFIKLA
jgi:hypothetical protein